MNKKSSTKYLVEAALIAAIYVCLNLLQELILPSTTVGTVQVRVSESLCVMALFTPAAIPGLTVGCVLSNLLSLGVMPVDVVIGSLATLLATLCVYALRGVALFKIPVLALTMPVLFNGVMIGLELELFYVKGDFEIAGFLLQALGVMIGEFVACVILGIPLYIMLLKTPLGRSLKTK